MHLKNTYLLVVIFIFLLSTFYLLQGCKDNNQKSDQQNLKRGQELFVSSSCINCHSLSGENLYGPNLTFNLDSEITVIRDSVLHKVKVNRDYIKRSIINPDYEKSTNFKSRKMAKTTLSEQEIDLIVDYLISINKNQ